MSIRGILINNLGSGFMRDIKINNLGAVLGPALSQKILEKKISLTQEPDTFGKEKFNLDNAMQNLASIKIDKNGEKVTKFDNNQLKEIKKQLEKAPEKWNSIQKLAKAEIVNSTIIEHLSSEKKELIDIMTPFVLVPSKNGKETKYKPTEIMRFACEAKSKNVGPENFAKLFPLTKTSISADNIIDLASIKPLLNKSDKAALKILDMEKSLGSNLKRITFNQDVYNNKEFLIQAETQDNIVKTELLDNKLNRCAIEETSIHKLEDGSKYQIKKINDYRNNTISKVRLAFDEKNMSYMTDEIRIIKDKNGNVIRKEYTSPSEVHGVFNIKYVNADGTETIVSSGKKDPNTGVVTVKKNMVSLDGTRTTYLYEDDPEGNRISDYKITDKKGNIILNNSKTFEVINDKKFITSKNNEKYEISINDYDLDVIDLNNPEHKVNIPFDRKIMGEKKSIIEALKQMPGEELFKIAQSTKKLVGMSEKTQRNSYYEPETKSIHAGNDLFVILHELGHAVDHKDAKFINKYNGEIETLNIISKDKKVQQIFEKERKAFNKAFPNAQRNHIDYFINKSNHYNGEIGGLLETIAESNAILTTPKSYGPRTIRTQYLQQYFPNTIALLDKLLSEKIS